MDFQEAGTRFILFLLKEDQLLVVRLNQKAAEPQNIWCRKLIEALKVQRTVIQNIMFIYFGALHLYRLYCIIFATTINGALHLEIPRYKSL